MVLRSRVSAPDWSAGDDPDREAKCRKHPLPTDHREQDDPWFSQERDAVHICNGTYDDKVCPMRDSCLHRALVNNEQYGVFGGLMVVQRRWIRRHIPRDNWRDKGLADEVPPIQYFDEEVLRANEEDAA